LVNDLSLENQEGNGCEFLWLTSHGQGILPHFLFRPEAHIVNVSRMGGFVPVPGKTIYGAAKAAVKLITEGLYSELKDTKVWVSVVFPGAVKINIMSNSGLETKGMDSNEDPFRLRCRRTNTSGNGEKLIFLFRLNPLMAVNMIQKKMKLMGRI
jgi:short-subunit dehydrogenase